MLFLSNISVKKIVFWSNFLSTTSIPLQNRQHRLKQNLNIQSNIPLRNILCIQSYNLLKIRDVTSTTHLPHSGNTRLNSNSGSVMKFILFQLIWEDWSGSDQTHRSSLCQLRNNFFSKISHKAQYYQLTLKISTKKEPLISQKSQILRFYVYSISPNCTILA